MPTSTIPKPIAITVTSGVKGQPITIRNRNNGDEIHTTLGATAKAVVDLRNFTNSYTVGDVIDFIVAGEQLGHNSLTLTAKPQSVTVTTATISTSLSRGI